MRTPRISASSYSNTAPLVWSFLYGQNHGKVELILDNAPARSAELLAQDRVDAALVPVIAFQTIPDAYLVPDVCVGARRRVRSVCLVTKGEELTDVKSVVLDVSSKTSVVLTKIIFREFLGFEPVWADSPPDLETMLADHDAALIIGDPALALNSASRDWVAEGRRGSLSRGYRTFDLAELWHQHTGLGFIFAMWMTLRDTIGIDFASARDEGLAHIDDIAANYVSQVGLGREEMITYLTESISFSADGSMQKGLDLYFKLAEKHGFIPRSEELRFV